MSSGVSNRLLSPAMVVSENGESQRCCGARCGKVRVPSRAGGASRAVLLVPKHRHVPGRSERAAPPSESSAAVPGAAALGR